MRPTTKRTKIHSLILYALVFFLPFSAMAVEEPQEQSLKGTAVFQGNIVTAADIVFGTAGWSGQTAYSVQNFVQFEIDFYNTANKYFHNLSFSVTCYVNIDCYGNPSSPNTITQQYLNVPLQVDYNPTVGATYKGIANFKFNGAYKVVVTIASINPGTLNLNDFPIFKLTNKLIVNRQYNFNNITTDQLSYTTNGKKLTVRWTPTNYPGAESFDLEWTYMDELSDAGIYINAERALNHNQLSTAILGSYFRNNSSRINLSKSSHEINLNYNKGFVLFRIRGVQYRNNDGMRLEGDWNYNALPCCNSVYNFFQQGIVDVDWHEDKLNWQYNAVFSEEGKRKEVIIYFDGSLRSRQTVTLNNEDQVSVVAESIYDALGRPSMNILPAPVSDNELKYFRLFNLNTNPTPTPVSYKDIPSANCSIIASPLSSSSGVEKYYSADNPFLADLTKPWNQAIPKSEGFPFTVTQYVPDNTGRVRAQGGVGQNFQLGSGHETKYYYGKPSQYELDRLFGTEAGDHTHYLKNMVVDANGQVSVSYQNSEGKTIATALAGLPPTNVAPLSSSTQPTTNIRDVILTPSSFQVNTAKSSLQATSTFLVPSTGEYKFTYKFTPEQYNENFSGGTLCYTCSYDLLITIKDECGNELSKVEIPNITPFNTACVPPNEVSNFFIDTINRVGEYTAYFELAVNKATLDAYTQHYLTTNTDIKKLNYFLLEQLVQENLAECYSDCDACNTLPEDPNEFVTKIRAYFEKENLPFAENETQFALSLYDQIQENCEIIRQQCIASPCDEILEVLKADVTPGGQYAEYDQDFNLVDPEINVLAHYNQVSYPNLVEDENGNMVSPASLSLKEFITKFEEEWADALVQFHPEYCYYTWCTMNSEAQQFINEVEELNDATEAMSPVKQWFDRTNPLALLEKDPFFTNLGAAFYGDMSDDLQNYSVNVLQINQPVKDILSSIDFFLYCGPDGIDWNSCYKDPNDACRSDYKEWLLYKEWYIARRLKYYYLAMEENLPECRNCFIPSSAPGDPVEWQNCIAPPLSDFTVEVVPNSSADGYKRIIIKYRGGNEVVQWPLMLQLSLYSSSANISLTQQVFFTPGFGSQELLVQDEFDQFSPVGISCADITQAKPAKTSAKLLGEWECPWPEMFTTDRTYNENTGQWELTVCYNGSAIPGNILVIVPITIVCEERSFNHELIFCSSKNCITLNLGKEEACNGEFDIQWGDIRCEEGTCAAPCPSITEFSADIAEGAQCPAIEGYSSMVIRVTHVGGPLVLSLPIQRVKVKVEIVTTDGAGHYYTDVKYVWFQNGDSYKDICFYYLRGRSIESIAIKGTECKGDCPSDDCCDDPLYSLYEGKVRRFQEYMEPDFNAILNNPLGDPNNPTAYPMATCKNECEMMADGWIEQLKGCTTDPVILEKLRRDLIDVCKQSCVAQSGNTVIRPFADLNPSPSFEEVITNYFGANTASCAYDLLSDPYPWGKVPKVEKTFATDASASICQRLEDLKQEAALEGYATDVNGLEKYLTDYYSPYYDLETKELEDLFKGCDCKYVMPLPVELPPFMDGDAKPCLDCDAYEQLVNAFNAKYPGITPSHPKYEVLFKNFANHETGFSHAYANYYDFGLKCEQNENDFREYGHICETPLLLEVDFNPLEQCLEEKFYNALSNATVIYTAYIEEVIRTYRNNYTAKCLSAKPKLESEAKLYEYHYTLYYYDQSSNLVKTVPPGGVDFLDDVEINALQADRTLLIVPSHIMASVYKYNSFNQVVEQTSPDGGTSYFWYDRLGRLTVSQNEEQRSPSNGGIANRYSYTRYEKTLGRIAQTGEKTGAADINTIDTKDDLALENWQNSGTNSQITITLYDNLNTSVVTNTSITNEQYGYTSRKRVISTIFKKLDYVSPSQYDAATHYSYDINGNAKIVWQENERLKEADASTQGLKRIDYEYDLISGKVNKMYYQKGMGDQFIYRYHYDMENRVINAESSRDGLLWHQDATHNYFLHGPLARTELGTWNVQGLDYAYTMQGWMKYINSPAINERADIGKDGDVGMPNNNFKWRSRDVMSYGISYFNGEYKPIFSGTLNFAENVPATMGTGENLFDGNIRATTVHLSQLGTPKTYSYSYDQLNRLVRMRKHETSYDDNAGNPTLNIALPTEEYKEDIVYDPNGNIEKYIRNGTAALLGMDSLDYYYYLGTNKLRTFTDNSSYTNNYIEDVDEPNDPNNYTYDKIGNLISDVQGGITKIEWTAYGKISKIIKGGTNPSTIEYEYSASGQRIFKKIIKPSLTSYIYYVRDAFGNALAIYTRTNTTAVKWSEQHLYSTTRIGIIKLNIPVPSTASVPLPGNTLYDGFHYGQTFYELSNHLGNVMSTISDKKIGVDDGTYAEVCPPCPPPQPGVYSNCGCYDVKINSIQDGVIDFFKAEVITQTDFYPFGMEIPERTLIVSEAYQYSINGQEVENELNRNITSAEFWMYDSRVARRWNVDPEVKVWESSYAAFSLNPVLNIDIKGNTAKPVTKIDNPGGGEKQQELDPIVELRQYLPDHRVGAMTPIDPGAVKSGLNAYSETDHRVTIGMSKVGKYEGQHTLTESYAIRIGNFSTENGKTYYTETLKLTTFSVTYSSCGKQVVSSSMVVQESGTKYEVQPGSYWGRLQITGVVESQASRVTSASSSGGSTAMLSPEAKGILTNAMKYSEEACMSPVNLIVEDAKAMGKTVQNVYNTIPGVPYKIGTLTVNLLKIAGVTEPEYKNMIGKTAAGLFYKERDLVFGDGKPPLKVPNAINYFK